MRLTRAGGDRGRRGDGARGVRRADARACTASTRRSTRPWPPAEDAVDRELGAVDLRAEGRAAGRSRRDVRRRQADLRCTPGRAPLAPGSRRGTSGPCSVCPAALSTMTQVASGVRRPCTPPGRRGDLPGAATTSWPVERKVGAGEVERLHDRPAPVRGPCPAPGSSSAASGRREDRDTRGRVVVRVCSDALTIDAGRRLASPRASATCTRPSRPVPR